MTTRHKELLTRAPAAICIVGLLMLVPIPGASAQTTRGAQLADPAETRLIQDPDRFAPRIVDAPERASIDLEASVATGLYVSAAIGLGLSAVLELAAVTLLMTEAPSRGFGALKSFEVVAAAGGVVGGVGALALALAIGLHVDSHSRRDALGRGTCTRLSLTPGGLVLSGSF